MEAEAIGQFKEWGRPAPDRRIIPAAAIVLTDSFLSDNNASKSCAETEPGDFAKACAAAARTAQFLSRNATLSSSTASREASWASIVADCARAEAERSFINSS